MQEPAELGGMPSDTPSRCSMCHSDCPLKNLNYTSIDTGSGISFALPSNESEWGLSINFSEDEPLWHGHKAVAERLPITRAPTRLYDIQQRKTVKLGFAKYGAISYAWDQWEEASLVETASKWALALGLQYIWFDKGCIDQNDPLDKQREVMRMAEYYRGAAATICLVPELTGSSITMGDCKESYALALVSKTMDRIRDALDQYRSSRWVSRVWTYQEGILGRNTLVVGQVQALPIQFLHLDRHLEIVIPAAEVNWVPGAEQHGIQTSSIRVVFALLAMIGGSIIAPKRPLAELMRETFDRGCSLDIDRVYGLAALSIEPIVTDYSLQIGSLMKQLISTGVLGPAYIGVATMSDREGDVWWPGPVDKTSLPTGELDPVTFTDKGILVEAVCERVSTRSNRGFFTFGMGKGSYITPRNMVDQGDENFSDGEKMLMVKNDRAGEYCALLRGREIGPGIWQQTGGGVTENWSPENLRDKYTTWEVRFAEGRVVRNKLRN
ncbi:hypothetical protein F5Y10DRAFT_236543 [Nemania abortiva]|nr:hypothetical protein F5Y10DRAFT_236543 [Nemania abortiva]